MVQLQQVEWNGYQNKQMIAPNHQSQWNILPLQDHAAQCWCSVSKCMHQKEHSRSKEVTMATSSPSFRCVSAATDGDGAAVVKTDLAAYTWPSGKEVIIDWSASSTPRRANQRVSGTGTVAVSGLSCVRLRFCSALSASLTEEERLFPPPFFLFEVISVCTEKCWVVLTVKKLL